MSCLPLQKEDEAKKEAGKTAAAQRRAAKAAEEAQNKADAQRAAEAEAARAEKATREKERQQQKAEQRRAGQAYAAMVAQREEAERAAEAAAASAGHTAAVQSRAVKQEATTAPARGLPTVPIPAAAAVLPLTAETAAPQAIGIDSSLGIGIGGAAQQQRLLPAGWSAVDVVQTDQEVANIAAALEASLLDASGSGVQLVSGAATDPGVAAEAVSGLSLAETHVATGEHDQCDSLITAVGHCLWRCTAFRYQVAVHARWGGLRVWQQLREQR